MFYAQFVLSKKGPLAKIWLAAHWEKKLTKTQVYETNIDNAVESILDPKVRMALRTTGHLLLGIVRIYSRKAKYLLADCNEAFTKIKLAFRPGAVDLPDDGHELNVNAMTLPEVFHDFDLALPEFSQSHFKLQLTANQSRREDITLNEDLPHYTAFGLDDEFGDGDFESAEFAREGSLDYTGITRPSEITLRPEISDRSRMDIDAPIDDDFGGHLDETLLNEGINEMFGGDMGRVADEVQQMEFDGVAGESDSEMGSSTAKGGSKGKKSGVNSELMEQTTLIQNEEEAFALEPLDSILSAQDKPHQKAKRRRKLVVDEVKSLSGDEIKAQLSDPSDTLAPLDLAPPTKKLMHWKETGSTDKLFSMPGVELVSKLLLKVYSSNLVTRSRDEDTAEGGVYDRLNLDEDITSVRASQESEIAREQSMDRGAADDHHMLPPISEERSPPSVSNMDGFSPLGVPGDVPYAEQQELEQIDRDAPQYLQDRQYEQGQEENGDEAEERRWNRRTQQVLTALQKQLKSRDAISFKEYTRNHSRKQAASKFYTLLVLKKWHCVEVSQDEPFADILIEPGPELNKRA